MRKMILLALLSMFLLISCSGNSTGPDNTASEQEIYRFIMDTLIIKSIDKQIVLADYSNDFFLKIKEPLSSDVLYKELYDYLKVSIDTNMCIDYTSKNKQRTKFTASQFAFNIPLVLLSTTNLSAVSIDSANIDWTKFYNKYIGAQGYSSISKIGFNKTADIALVYVDVMHDIDVGSAYYVILQKVTGVWKIYKYLPL